MKKIISILIFIIGFMFVSNIFAEEYEKYHSGDIVRYNDIAFYVLFDSDSTEESVQLLKMVPLSHEEINKYTDNKASLYVLYNNNLEYRKSDEKYAYGNMAFYYGDNCYYKYTNSANSWFSEVYSGCLNEYESSNVKTVIDKWTQDNINNYDIVAFEDGYNSKLLNIDEIAYFDSNIDISKNSSEYNLNNELKWLYLLNYNGWTMTENEKCYYNYNGVVTSCSNNIYVIYSSRYADGNSYSKLLSIGVSGMGSVRPTIKLKKSSISRVSFNEYHNNAVREYKIGDIINYNDTKFYVIKDSSDSDSTVTLLKDIPLTKYELETYGEGYINNYIYSYNWNNVNPGTVIFENGLNKVAYLSTNKCYSNYRTREYDLSGCNQNYDVSNVKHIVDNWTLGMINNSDITEDEIGYSSRLIDSDDLTDLGYISIQANTSGNENFKTGKDTPEFMSNDNTKGMLTMIPSYTYNNGTEMLYGITVADDGYVFLAQGIPNGAIGTVRPVVTLNKKEIAPKITNVEEIEDTVNGDSEANNIEVDIVSNVDNTTNINTNTNNVEVPNTLSSKNITIIFVGLIVLVAGIITFIYYKKK